MNIAIVNDEKFDSEAVELFLRVYIKKFWAHCESRIHIEIFRSAKEFITFFSPKIYNLVILGINMQEIARFIRANDDFGVKILFWDACEED